MKVYTINSSYNGCCYLRIMLPTFHNGFLSNKQSLKGNTESPQQMQANLMDADVVVFHRPETKEYLKLIDVLKADGKKVVIDNDDTFILDDVHPLANFTADAQTIDVEARSKSMDEALSKADLVTASTDFLAEEYKKLNDNVLTLPNCVDEMEWDEPLRNEGDKVRIGLVGSVSFQYDYHHVRNVIRELGDRNDVELVLFGLGDAAHRKKNPTVTRAFQPEYDFWDSVQKEQIPWCPIYDYHETLRQAKLDLLMIPRKENYFNKCKSNVKFLEAAMCEVPVVAQSFEDGPYEKITEDMGILIKDDKDWIRELDRLIKNKDLRRSMGKKAREHVINNYNIEDHAHKWADAYMKLCEK